MPTFYGAVDLAKNELRNAVVQNLGSAPTTPANGQLWYDSANQILKWWNGTTWISAMSGSALTPAATVTTQAVGDAGVVGTSANYAREDHKHGREAFGGTVVAETTFGLASSIGTAVTLPRSDHTHGSPTHDAAAHTSLLGNVTVEQTFGSASNNGVAGTISRSDHAHGNPTHDATAHTSLLGNVTVEQTFGTASANGVATTISRSDHAHGNPTHVSADHITIPLSTFAAATAQVNLGSQKIVNLLDPTNPQDAATKNYVDNAVAGLTWKNPARAATTANLAALSGTMTVDGVALVAGDRILVKNQTTQANNGIYVVAAGAWARATDAATSAQLVNAAVWISEGTTQQDTAWTQTTNAPITVGTTALVWVQFSGGGTYGAGNGLTLTGSIFAVGAGTGILSTPGQVAVDTTVIATQAYVTTALTGTAKKYAANLVGTASPEVITHNLNTRDVQVTVLNGASPYTACEVDWDATTVNTVTIRYNPNLGAGYRIVVTG